MSSVPLYAINTSGRMAASPRSALRFKTAGAGECDAPELVDSVDLHHFFHHFFLLITAAAANKAQAQTSSAPGSPVPDRAQVTAPSPISPRNTLQSQVQDTNSMKKLTQKHFYQEGERMCALGIFN